MNILANHFSFKELFNKKMSFSELIGFEIMPILDKKVSFKDLFITGISEKYGVIEEKSGESEDKELVKELNEEVLPQDFVAEPAVLAPSEQQTEMAI